ncbi:MAG: hypothetical protein EBU46_19650 [Nitrosomonadaceae bacterium]|nr:hypothetical protein [Nitrosomonadaceae bacterium]
MLSFGGSAQGDIAVKVDSSTKTLTFTRNGKDAICKIDDLNDGGISAPGSNARLVMSDAVFNAIRAKLAGNVSLKISDTTLALADLKTIETATTGLVDATSVTSTSGTVADAKLMMVTNEGTTGDKIDMASNVAVTLSAGAASALNLKAIEASTSGLVDARAITSITGSIADVKLMLLTNAGKTGDKINLSDHVAVNLTDTGSISDINLIFDVTTGVVSIYNPPNGMYTKISANDKINTGLTFTDHTSQTIDKDGELNWNWNSSTNQLMYEKYDSGTDNSIVTLTLTGITQVQEADGFFTLLTT